MRLKSAPGSEIEVRFHPGVQSEVKGGYVLLSGKSGKMAMIPVVSQQFTILEGKHATNPVNATRPFAWINYFGTIVKAENDNTLIATIILPVNDDNEAQQIVKSVIKSVDVKGSYTLSFKKGGKSYKYLYKNAADGLMLENTN